jgi:hypothetical protein
MTSATNQELFYALLQKYNNGIEPLESWADEDIETLFDIVTDLYVGMVVDEDK